MWNSMSYFSNGMTNITSISPFSKIQVVMYELFQDGSYKVLDTSGTYTTYSVQAVDNSTATQFNWISSADGITLTAFWSPAYWTNELY